jgi:PAS domain S-box-containing protein
MSGCEMVSPARGPEPIRPRKALGIKTFLFALLSVLTAIPVLWLGSQHAARVREHDRHQHDQALATEARSVARQFEQMLETRCRDLELLASSIEVLGGPTAEGARELLVRHWGRSGYYTGTYLGDIHGNALRRVTEQNPDGAPGQPANYADRDYFRSLLRTERTTISMVQKGKVLDTLNVQIASPIFDRAHRLVGYSEGSVSLDAFAVLVRSVAADVPGSRIVVLDGGGRVVADSSANGGGRLTDLSAVPLFRDSGAQADVRTAPDEQGDEMRAALQTIGPLLPGWRVVAAKSQAAIADQSNLTRNQTWATALVAWLLVVVLSGAVAVWFGRRISDLADTVSAIGKGDFSRRAAPAQRWEPQEIRVLIEEVGATADRLSTHTGNLETMVQERTQALARVNERLLTLVDALERAGDGIEITDPQARFIYVNPAWEKVTGYNRTEVAGRSPALLRSGTLPEAFYEAIWQTIQGGEVYSGAFPGRRKDGTLFDQELTVWPVRNREGEMVHIVGLRRDVTEKTRTEHALRISERMASVGTLAAGIAHEINNPLTYVLISLRFAQAELQEMDDQSRPEIREALERALEGAERVNAIVKELRVFSRPNDRTLTVIDPRSVLESALRLVDNDIRHRAHLVREFRAIPDVLGNDARLSQVFLNLLVNAVQALESCARERSEITVRTSTDDKGFAVIEISDTGVGIAPEHLSKIFDPFFTTKPVGLGTGIGLSICHGIVKSMNGVIEVDSTLGRGSVFRIRLPSAPESARPALASTATGPRLRAGARLRILIVDDDQRVAEAMRQTLSNHDVTLADGAESALQALQTAEYDAIFCDLMMPETTGVDFFERLSERNPSQQSRVIFITGGAPTEHARGLLDRTQAICLYKPVTGEELEEALQRLTATVGPRAFPLDPPRSSRNRDSPPPAPDVA